MRRADENNVAEAVVFDIDGTLACNAERVARLDPDNPDWDSFHEELHLFPPLEAQTRLAEMLWCGGFVVIILTGRPMQYREVTKQWLAANDLQYDELHMPNSDNVHPNLKAVQLAILAKKYNVRLLVDDDPKMVAAAADMDIPTIYVHSGYYDRSTWGTALSPTAESRDDG